MKKKIINWLGIIVILGYVFMLSVLLFIAILVDNAVVKAIFIGLAIVWSGIVIAFIPDTLHKTWAKVLPERKERVRLIAKSTNHGSMFIRGVAHPVVTMYLTFEFSDGTRMAFPVNTDSYHTVIENETGILTFKGQGKRNYFVSFERKL